MGATTGVGQADAMVQHALIGAASSRAPAPYSPTACLSGTVDGWTAALRSLLGARRSYRSLRCGLAPDEGGMNPWLAIQIGQLQRLSSGRKQSSLYCDARV